MVNLALDNHNEIIGEFKLSINQSPTPLKTPDLYTIPVKSQKKTTISPHGFILNSENLLSELAQSPWITMGNNCPFDEALHNKLKQSTKANIQTSDDDSRLQLVKANQGLSFIEYDEAIMQEITILSGVTNRS